MKVFSLLSVAALTTCLSASGFSEEGNPSRMNSSESQYETIISQQTGNGYHNDYSSSNQMKNSQNGNTVRNSSHGCIDQGFSFQAEFLWWRAVLDNLEYAIPISGTVSNSQRTTGAYDITGEFRHPKFSFDPGVRLSLGYDFGASNWDVFARWTYHSSDDRDSTTGGLGVIPLKDFYVQSGSQVFATAQSAKAKWENEINIADLEMGYNYFFSDRFSFRPYFGLKASWIDMEYNITYGDVAILGTTSALNVAAVDIRNKTNWWGVGPEVGMDGYLHIGWGFSLYGRVSGALMYGPYDNSFHEPDTNANSIALKSNNNYRQRAMSQLLIGLEWAKCFSNNIFFALNIGWEGQYWWNQHGMRMIFDNQPSGDLTLTGLDVGMRLGF